MNVNEHESCIHLASKSDLFLLTVEEKTLAIFMGPNPSCLLQDKAQLFSRTQRRWQPNCPQIQIAPPFYSGLWLANWIQRQIL